MTHLRLQSDGSSTRPRASPVLLLVPHNLLLLDLDMRHDIGDSEDRLLGEGCLVQRLQVQAHLLFTALQDIGDDLHVRHILDLVDQQLYVFPLDVLKRLHPLVAPLDAIPGPHGTAPRRH